MRNVLLTSPDFIRSNSNISDNINSKVLATAIRNVQDDELQQILGTLLLEKLQDLIETGKIDDNVNSVYKDTLDKAQMFIVYKVIAETIVIVNCKIDNAGLLQTRDENMDYMNLEDTFQLKEYYDSKASHYAYLLQNYLLEHRASLPELNATQAYKIHNTLYSAASPSVFLGGARGRGYNRFWPYRYQKGINLP